MGGLQVQPGLSLWMQGEGLATCFAEVQQPVTPSWLQWFFLLSATLSVLVALSAHYPFIANVRQYYCVRA